MGKTVDFQRPDGQVVQVTDPRDAAKKRLATMEIEPPTRALGVRVPAAATRYQRDPGGFPDRGPRTAIKGGTYVPRCSNSGNCPNAWAGVCSWARLRVSFTGPSFKRRMSLPTVPGIQVHSLPEPQHRAPTDARSSRSYGPTRRCVQSRTRPPWTRAAPGRRGP